METMIVRQIDDQGDRVVFRGDNALYKVIAPPGQAARGVEIGDTISYERDGLGNVGWFTAKQDERDA